MNKNNVTLEQVLPSLKNAIVKIKGGTNDEILSVDTLPDDEHLIDLKGGIDELDVIELVMEVEKELEILVDDRKATEQNLYEYKTITTLTVKSLAETILSLI